MYVDIDPIAVAHAKAIRSGNPNVGVLQADLRHPIDIVDHTDTNALLDFSNPVAVMMAPVRPSHAARPRGSGHADVAR